MDEPLSVSRINCFLGCPRRYRYRYVDRAPKERRSAAAALGSVVHSALAWWQEERIEGREPSKEDVHRVLRADVAAEVALGDLELEDPVAWGVQSARLVDLGVAHLQPSLPIEVEVLFEVELHGLDVPLLGYIDWVGTSHFGELKTTSRRGAASQWSLQLVAYAMAVEQVYGIPMDARVVQLVKTQEPSVKEEIFVATDWDRARFLHVANGVVEAIELGAFFPNPGWMCRGCEFADRCRKEMGMAA